MSFTVDLIISTLPENDKDAWRVIEEMRERYYEDEGEKSPLLIKLHEELILRYPCLSSYKDDDEDMENSPWADGPMLGNFASEMGMLAVVWNRADEVFPFILEKALALGITVADGQSEKIYRPGDALKLNESKPWWKFW